MMRALLSLICAICIGGTAHADAKPVSLEEQSYNGNTMFNEELDGKAFLNGRLIVRVERVATCVSAVWTRSGGVGSALRRDLLEWDKMFNGDPWTKAQSYYLTFVYTDHRSDDVVSMPLMAHPDYFEDTAAVTLLSCQPKRHHRK